MIELREHPMLMALPLEQRRSAVRMLQRMGLMPKPESLPRAERVARIREAGERGLLARSGLLLPDGNPAIMGAARIRDLTVLPNLDTQPNGTLTSTATNYFIAPSGRAFMMKNLTVCMAADADFTTGDEDISFAVDYTVDGAAWVAVASIATLGGILNGDQFLQYEPVTMPVVAASQAITTMASAEIDVRVPGETVVRVVMTLAGTTPIFTGLRVAPMGHFI